MPDDSAELIEVLEDIRRWVKIIGIQEAKPVLQEVLTSEDEEEQWKRRAIYHLTDGENSTRDIADAVGSSRSTVSRRQSEWADLGLVEREGSYSPYERVISLQEAGFEIPDIPKQSDKDGDSDG